MGTSKSIGQFVGKINAAARALEKAQDEQLKDLAEMMSAEFDKAVAHDLNVTGTSHGFSNWVQVLEARGKVQGDELIFAPYGKSKGPTRVAEQGRQYGSSSDLVLVGRVRKKTGTRRGKSRGRNQGSTEGKGTWTDATDAISDKLPKQLKAGFTKAAMEVFR